MTLGEKIRQCRQEMHQTQQELAEGIVTRNMLSQIESGAAQPSLPTLLALAKRLCIPAGYLLEEETDSFPFRKISVMPGLYALFGEGRFAECLKLAEEAFGDRNDDETAFFRCEAACRAAEAELVSGSLSQAKQHAAAVPGFAAKTSHVTHHLLAAAHLFSAIAENPQAPRLELDEPAYCREAETAVNSDLFHYLRDDVNHIYTDEAMARHMAARKLMTDDRFAAALKMLEALESEKLSLKIGAYVLFRIYGDMEYCAKSTEDFERAYRMSVKRMALFSVFKS